MCLWFNSVSCLSELCVAFILSLKRPVIASSCRQAVPLAVALLNVGAPKLGAMDMLSRLSHDTDLSVAQNAVVALGELSRQAGLQALQNSCFACACQRLLTVVSARLSRAPKGLRRQQSLLLLAMSGMLHTSQPSIAAHAAQAV